MGGGCTRRQNRDGCPHDPDINKVTYTTKGSLHMVLLAGRAREAPLVWMPRHRDSGIARPADLIPAIRRVRLCLGLHDHIIASLLDGRPILGSCYVGLGCVLNYSNADELAGWARWRTTVDAAAAITSARSALFCGR